LDTFEWSVENPFTKDNLGESCRKESGRRVITASYFGLKGEL
jgi:hypothetical protein